MRTRTACRAAREQPEPLRRGPCAFPTRQRKAGGNVHSGVRLVAVETTALAGRDGRTVVPGSVGVRELRALRAVVEQELLTVGVGGKVGAVDGDVLAEVGQFVAQRCKNRSDAGVERALVLPRLRVKR